MNLCIVSEYSKHFIGFHRDMEKILNQYTLFGVDVTIKDVNGIGIYIIKDPPLDNKDKKLADKYIHDIYEKGIKYNYTQIIEYLSDFHIDQPKLEKMAFYIFKKLTYSDLTIPYFDSKIEKIECYGLNKPISVIHTSYKNYKRLYTNVIFKSMDEIKDLLVRFNNKMDFKEPRDIGEFYTYDNSEILYYIDNGIVNFEIIKFNEEQPIITNIIKDNNIDLNTISYLWEALEHKPFYIIVGNEKNTHYLFNSLLYLLPQYVKIVTVEKYPRFNFKDRVWLSFHTYTQYKTRLISSINKYEPDFVLLDLELDYMENLLKYFPTQCGLLIFSSQDSVSNTMNLISNYLPRNLEKILLDKLDAIIVYNNKLHIFEKYKLGNKIKFREIKIPKNPNELAITPYIRKIIREYGSNYSNIVNNIIMKSDLLKRLKDNNIIDSLQIQEMLLRS
jgi:type IV secretory pathway ATPase VirB11/archaellum biosynthesis ATPase